MSLPGTVHLGYQHKVENRLREKVICELLRTASSSMGTEMSDELAGEFVALDIGCGSGHLMKTCRENGLEIEGADFDPVCVSLSGRFGRTKLIGERSLDEYFEKESFDCLVFSHSLEHFDSPLHTVQQAKRISRKFLLFAVPNPCRLQTILITNPLRHDYSNRGHLCSWDRSHFTVFLTQRCGLEIVEWGFYKMGIFALLPLLMKILRGRETNRRGLDEKELATLSGTRRKRTFGSAIKKAIEPVEMSAGRMFPYLADELVVLTAIPSHDPSHHPGSPAGDLS